MSTPLLQARSTPSRALSWAFTALERTRGGHVHLRLARPDRERPARPLRLAEPGFFDGWGPPVTNAGRFLRPTNLFFPTENIVDVQHFYAVHHWQLHSIVQEPQEVADGSFSAVMRMTWTAGAQSESALLRQLGKAYSSTFDFHIAILGPGLALSISRLAPEQGSLELMNIILITPVSATDCHIRVVSSVKRHFEGH